MKNGHGMPVLDRRTLVEPPKPQTKTVHEREVAVSLVLNRCAAGCKRWGHFQLGSDWWCECCVSAEIVRTMR